jgi:DNA-binding NarL/FixJ family response regulator
MSSKQHLEPDQVLFAQLGEVVLAIVSYTVEPARLESKPDKLTDAEQDMLTRVLRGERNAEIAAARRTSVSTVKKQICSLFRRLGVSSRAELAAQIWGNTR